MKKVTFISIVFMVAFVLLGLGCASSPELTPSERNMGITNPDPKPEIPVATIPGKVLIVTMLLESLTDDKFVSVKRYKGDDKQVVFYCGKKQYTVFYSKGSILSFWVRPKGSKAEGLMKTFSDEDFDGNVDFGISGDSEFNPDAPTPYRFIQPHETVEDKVATRKFWQDLYDVALEDAKQCMN